MFLRILRKSFSRRKGKIAIAIIAVIIGAAIPSALLMVSMDVTEKVNLEFRKFGANLLLVPKSDTIEVGIGNINFGSVTDQRYINETDLYKIKTISWSKNILGYAPQLYQVAKAETEDDAQNVVLVGTWFQKDTYLEDGTVFRTGVKKINGWWHVKGMWVTDIDDNSTMPEINECMIGTDVSEKLGLKLDDELVVKYRERPDDEKNETSARLKVVGIITSGGSEDNYIYTDLSLAQVLTGRENKVHTVQVSALCTGCPVEDFAVEIEAEMPYVEGKTVKQLTGAEMSLLGKIEEMMFLVSIVALLASALGVFTTMTTSVIERQKEIGLMKSIGAENRKIAALFLTEAAIIGIIGGVLGYYIGIELAQFIGMRVFDSSISPRLIVLPIIIGISLFITLFASALPVRRAVKIEPVVVLRGE